MIAARILAVPLLVFAAAGELSGQAPDSINLSTSKTLQLPVPGGEQRLNSLPIAMALSPDKRYLAVLNNGFGTAESNFEQSIAILDLETKAVTDFPDSRLGQDARQTYFIGLAFSGDGKHLYASLGSLTDPPARKPGSTGNGIAVYDFADGKIAGTKVLRLAPENLSSGKHGPRPERDQPANVAPPFPAGIAVVNSPEGERLLVADDLADDALLLNAHTGETVRRFDLSRHKFVPAEFPYAAIATRDGKTGYISLWNASEVAKVDLNSKRVHFVKLRKPKKSVVAGSHPTALLLSPDERWLYVTLSNTDEVAIVDAAKGKVRSYISVKLPGQKYGGNYPNALAQSEDGRRLFVANASSDAIAVFDLSLSSKQPSAELKGFIPTEWYPTALAVRGGELFIASGKGRGTGPNNFNPPSSWTGREKGYGYIPTLLHGSLSRVKLSEIDRNLPEWTGQVLASNLMRGNADSVSFPSGANPIKHVIYVIKENRTYDQILGDLGSGDGDASLTMYGEDITPNEHKLARQFGVLDNFYTSGEVSGNGHVWSTAAITSDYTEKTWQIGYRSYERTYDYEGEVDNAYPLQEKIPDVDEPGTGYLWANFARNHISYRHYGEFVASEWCNASAKNQSPKEGTPESGGATCAKASIEKGDPLPSYLGRPHGSPSPWPWSVPILYRDLAAKPALRNHFDPRFADFNIKYPDQLRMDEFLDEFGGFVQARETHHGHELPQFVMLRLPNDHTAGTRPGSPTPSASVADNDLAVGRLVEAVSHSPYWDDTAIFILEDDAQNGPDHVDAHRSIAWVISKYAPTPDSSGKPFVDHTFYTTVNVVHTMESLLGAPPMNNNDSQAALMSAMFSGRGDQPAFSADQRNLQNGLIYQMNTAQAAGAKESAGMDFSHADAADADALNRILWLDRMGEKPFPAVRHTFFH